MSEDDKIYQEHLPVMIARLFHLQSEFWIRFPFALAGSLTILAVYHSVQDKRFAILAAMIVAVCPLFVFWSRMGRPYAMAGLFVALDQPPVVVPMLS